jgi:Asp-tRNA(Asn)/Glu-tRNA(Gln) amidotransferase A subunit family amidase
MIAAASLRGQGVRVDEVELDWPLQQIADVLIEGIFGIYLREYLDHVHFDAGKPVSSYLRWLIDSHKTRACSILEAGALAARLHADLQNRVWGAGYNALLCPTLLTCDVAADLDMVAQRTLRVGDAQVDSYLGWVATPAFNLLSRCPVIAVPTGFAENHVPTSMQVVAAPYRDVDAFHVAWLHARASGGDPFHRRQPDLPSAAGQSPT